MYRSTTVLVKLSYLLCGLLAASCLLGTSMLYAQADSCDPTFTKLSKVVDRCSELNHNWACYGDSISQAVPSEIRFYEPNDRQPLKILKSVTTNEPGGATVMNLLLADGQAPITVMLYGGTTLSPKDKNVFQLRIENNTTLCTDTPSGMIIKTAAGQRGSIMINGVEIKLESVAFIALPSTTTMNVVNLAGKVTISTTLGTGGAQQVTVPQAQQVEITQQNGVPSAIGQPAPAPAYGSIVLQWLANDPNGLSRIKDHNAEPSAEIPACTGEINYGETVTGQNTVPGQECLFTFTGAAGDAVTIQVEVTSGLLDPWVDLRGPDMNLVTFNNDRAGSNINSQICNQVLPVSGQYTIVARPAQNQSTGSFRLTLNHQTDCEVSAIATPEETPTPAPLPACYKVQPVNWCAYRVRSGDTLTDIARRSGARLPRLREVNCKLNTDIIRIGEILFVPCAPTPTPTPTQPPEPQCEPLVIDKLDISGLPSTSSGYAAQVQNNPYRTYVTWHATGGCDPVSGQFTVLATGIVSGSTTSAILGQRLRSVTGRAEESRSVQYPAMPDRVICQYTFEYILTLTDGRGQTTSQRRFSDPFLTDQCSATKTTP